MRDEEGLYSRWPHRRCGDGLEQMGPVLEDRVNRDGPQMLEEAVGRATRDDGCSPGEDAEIGGGVE